eukprot:299222-Prymnesium_polylepis.1
MSLHRGDRSARKQVTRSRGSLARGRGVTVLRAHRSLRRSDRSAHTPVTRAKDRAKDRVW